MIYISFLGPSLLLVSPTVSHSARELMWSSKAPRLSRAGRPHPLLTTETSLTRCMTCPGPRPPLTRRCWPPAPCPTWRPPGPGRSSTGSSAPSPSTPARTPSAWWRRTTASARKILSDTQTVITASRCSMCCQTNPPWPSYFLDRTLAWCALCITHGVKILLKNKYFYKIM